MVNETHPEITPDMEGIVDQTNTLAVEQELSDETSETQLTQTIIQIEGNTQPESAEGALEDTEISASEVIVETNNTEVIATTEAILQSESVPVEQSYVQWVGWFFIAAGLMTVTVIALILSLIGRSKRKTKAIHKKGKDEQSVTVTNDNADLLIPQGVCAVAFQELGAREDQQDSFGITEINNYFQEGVLAVIADGMGGLANGKAVSSLLVETFLGNFKSFKSMKPDQMLLELAVRGNYIINQKFLRSEKCGSTLVAAIVRDGYLNFLSVGDSRIYLYRNGGLIQLNREHVYREELAVNAVDRRIPVAEITEDKQSRSLTSYFGIGTIPHLDRNCEAIKLISGDRIILCTDGVFGTLSQDQMEGALQHTVKDAAAMMRNGILEARIPYQDNNTALILEYFG